MTNNYTRISALYIELKLLTSKSTNLLSKYFYTNTYIRYLPIIFILILYLLILFNHQKVYIFYQNNIVKSYVKLYFIKAVPIPTLFYLY